MSRIGKKPVVIPAGVAVTIEGQVVTVRGSRGELSRRIRPELAVEVSGSAMVVKPVLQTRKTSAYWGLTRSLLAAMVGGVSKGFEKRLEIEGIGYRVAAEGERMLRFSLGFSHPVEFKAPQGVELKVAKNTITVSGVDKELVGRVAAEIRALRPPEPYKGKGVRYAGEVIRRKTAKKAVTAGS